MIEGYSIPTEADMDEVIHTIFVFHAHHDILFEPMLASGIENRKWDILVHKKKTAERRLELMRPVQWEIPADLQAAADRMWETLRALCFAKGHAEKDEIETARKIWVAAQNAYDALERHYQPEFYAAHRNECPGCMWNGVTMFAEEIA